MREEIEYRLDCYLEGQSSYFSFEVDKDGNYIGDKSLLGYQVYLEATTGKIDGKAVVNKAMTSYIHRFKDIECSICGKVIEELPAHVSIRYSSGARYDAMGYYETTACDKCYNSDKYPYKKNRTQEEYINDALDCGENPF